MVENWKTLHVLFTWYVWKKGLGRKFAIGTIIKWEVHIPLKCVSTTISSYLHMAPEVNIYGL